MATGIIIARPLQTASRIYYSPLKLLKIQPLLRNSRAYRTDTARVNQNCCSVFPKRRTALTLYVRQYTQKTEVIENSDTFVERLRKFWRGPTFKYWFIGVTALSSWLAYYSLKSYRSTRVNVTLPVAIPNHTLVDRKHDVDAIFKALEGRERIGGKVQCVLICGPSGSGKSMLSKFVAHRLMEQIDWNPFGLPKSHVNVFLCGDTLKGFLLSLQAFAARLKIKPIDIKRKMDEFDKIPTTTEQCRTILELIREKLQKHPNWVMVIDNLQQGSSDDVIAILNDMILVSNASSWSKGTIILTSDGADDNRLSVVPKYQVKPRFVYLHLFLAVK